MPPFKRHLTDIFFDSEHRLTASRKLVERTTAAGVVLATALSSPAVAAPCTHQATPGSATYTLPAGERPFSIAVNGDYDDNVPKYGNDASEITNVWQFYQRAPLDPAAPDPTGTGLRSSHGNLWIVETDPTSGWHRDSKLLRTYSGGGVYGNISILFEGRLPASGDPAGNAPDAVDRQELTLSQSGGDVETILEFGEWRYLRFFLKVDASFGINQDGSANTSNAAMISQVWQRGSNTVGPPFYFTLSRVTGDAGIHVNAAYRNADYNDEQLACGTGEGAAAIMDQVIAPGQWVGFMVAMKPVFKPFHPSDPVARGAIMIWRLDSTDGGVNWRPGCFPNYSGAASTGLVTPGVYPYDTAHLCNINGQAQFFWGYRPNASTGLEGKFDIRVGEYRQPRIYSLTWMDTIMLSNNEKCLRTMSDLVPGTAVCP